MKERIDLIKSIFNQFNGRNIEILNQLYEDDVSFQDPVGSVKGLSQLSKYYAHAYKNVRSIKFEFQNFISEQDQLHASWIMTAEVLGLNHGKPVVVEGVSVFKFSARNKITYHRDYLDLGQMVYENIWGLGAIIRKVKSLLRADL